MSRLAHNVELRPDLQRRLAEGHLQQKRRREEKEFGADSEAEIKLRLAGSPSYLAKKLGVDTRTVQRWCSQGLIVEANKTEKGRWKIPYRTGLVGYYRERVTSVNTPRKRRRNPMGSNEPNRELAPQWDPEDTVIDLWCSMAHCLREDCTSFNLPIGMNEIFRLCGFKSDKAFRREASRIWISFLARRGWDEGRYELESKLEPRFNYGALKRLLHLNSSTEFKEQYFALYRSVEMVIEKGALLPAVEGWVGHLGNEPRRLPVLVAASARLRINGLSFSVQNLAHLLGITRQKLYRQYTTEEIATVRTCYNMGQSAELVFSFPPPKQRIGASKKST